MTKTLIAEVDEINIELKKAQSIALCATDALHGNDPAWALVALTDITDKLIKRLDAVIDRLQKDNKKAD